LTYRSAEVYTPALRSLSRAAVFLPIVLFCAPAQDPGVFVSAPVGPSIRMFDPANPPIPITPPEVAITRFEPSARGANPQLSFDGTTLTVAGMPPPGVMASITVFLPYNVTPNITEHENGHVRLCRYAYGKVAQRVASAAWAGFTGARFVGRGMSPEQRRMDAVRQIDIEGRRRATQAVFGIAAEVSKLNNIYDDLTQHGNNPAIDTAAGEAMARQRYEAGEIRTTTQLQPPAGRPPVRPGRSKRNKALALAVILCGGALLLYGVFSYARG
jgi:hypothetical protein